MTNKTFPPQKTFEVGGACLCLHTQRAARALARHFDEAFRPLDLTSGQFSLLMSLNRSEPPTVGQIAAFLAMDRTTLTALIKPLERRGLVTANTDAQDRRKRRLQLTEAGHTLLFKAYPVWKKAHAELETGLSDPDALRAALRHLALESDKSRPSLTQ